MPKYCLLSKLPENSKLFKNCMEILTAYDPEKWPKENILYAFNNLGYDCFICTNGNRKIVGVIVFNPNRQEKIAKAFLVHILQKFEGRGIGSSMTAEFIIYALNHGFNGAQIGLGNNEKMTHVLNSVKRRQKELLGDCASRVEIDISTGTITFKS